MDIQTLQQQLKDAKHDFELYEESLDKWHNLDNVYSNKEYKPTCSLTQSLVKKVAESIDSYNIKKWKKKN